MPAESALCLDSFLFQRRGFLGEQHGFKWTWDYACPDEVLSGLEFELVRVGGRPPVLRFRYRAVCERGEEDFDYPVSLDWTRCSGGGRWWFLCPHIGKDGEVCGRRSRYLFLGRSQLRVGCRKCVGSSYPSSRRNHDPVYCGLLKPLEALEQATLRLLRCRSEKKRTYLKKEADAARQRIREFSTGPWREIVSRAVSGQAGVRDRRRFSELVGRFVDRDVQHFVECTFMEPEDIGEVPEVDLGLLFFRLIEGTTQIRQWEEAATMFRAARRPGNTAYFLLSALVTYEIHAWLRPDDDCALMALEKALLAGDRQALWILLRLLQRKVDKRLAS